MMHEENGLFPLDEPRVRGLIESVLGPSPPQPSPIIGVVGSPGDIEATMCLTLNRFFYTDQWHLTDIWFFIRPDCRKKMLIESLIGFAKSCAFKAHLPYLSGVLSNHRTEAKVRIFRRYFGDPIGSAFLYDPEKRAI